MIGRLPFGHVRAAHGRCAQSGVASIQSVFSENPHLQIQVFRAPDRTSSLNTKWNVHFLKDDFSGDRGCM